MATNGSCYLVPPFVGSELPFYGQVRLLSRLDIRKKRKEDGKLETWAPPPPLLFTNVTLAMLGFGWGSGRWDR